MGAAKKISKLAQSFSKSNDGGSFGGVDGLIPSKRKGDATD